MIRSTRPVRVVLALTAALLAGGLVPGPAGAVPPTPPRVVAKPADVMVNTKITLSGSGFAAHATLAIRECSVTNWVVVAQQPCDTANGISAVTDRLGRFRSSFTVQLCPRKPGPGPVTRETCYVGSRKPRGIDTMTLVGAARIIVTYP